MILLPVKLILCNDIPIGFLKNEPAYLQMSFLEVKNVSKLQQQLRIVSDISFTQNQGQKIAVAGETGSGKSTLLKMIAGLVQPDSGEICFEGIRVKGPMEKLLPGHPKIAYLSQHFELRNNYRIEEELDYLNCLSEEEADSLFGLCRISHLLKRKTTEVSGGEKQRISLARLLLSTPRLLLLDEPYSNLDIIHKNILKRVLQDVSEKLNITCMLISHDPNDLLSWADEMLVIKDGVVVQQGTPQEIYHRPVNEYAAALLGSYNLLTPSLYNSFLPVAAESIGSKVFIRPEQFVINSLHMKFVKGRVEEVRFLGNANEADVRLDSGDRITVRTGLMNMTKGNTVRASLALHDLYFID